MERVSHHTLFLFPGPEWFLLSGVGQWKVLEGEQTHGALLCPHERTQVDTWCHTKEDSHSIVGTLLHVHTNTYTHMCTSTQTQTRREECVSEGGWGKVVKNKPWKDSCTKLKKKTTTNKCVLYTLYLFVFTPSFSVEGSRAEQCCSWQVNHILYDGLLVTVTVDPLDSVHSLSENTLYHYGGGLF